MPSKNAFGLDIGDTSLKLVWLNKRGFVRAFGEIGLAKGVIEKNMIKDKVELVKAIKELISSTEGKKIKTQKVIACLPEPKTFIKVIEIPAEIKKNEIEKFILEKISHYLPLSADEIYVDWQVLPKVKNNLERVLIGAVPRKVADDYFDLLTAAGLEVKEFQIEAVSIANALVFRKKEKETSQIIIDLGANRSSLILFDQGTIQFSISLPISGLKITDEIASKFKISFLEAEKKKIKCGLKEASSKEYKIIEKNFSEVAEEIDKALKFYRHQSGRSIDQILLCGGGAQTKNLPAYLSSKTNLKVSLANPFINLKPQMNQKIKFSGNPISFTTAIGLALRGIDYN